MTKLILALSTLYLFYKVIKYALLSVGLELKPLMKDNFHSFLYNIFAVFFKILGRIFHTFSLFFQRFFDLEVNIAKLHEGFMPWREKILILNPFYSGLLMNGSRARLTTNHSFTHSIIVANTGRGKTSSFVIPNIFTLDNCSILATDLSGELFQKTSGKMKEKGFEIKTLNLFEIEKSSSFNPLATVKTDKDILEVVEILFLSAGMTQDPFWNSGAKTILRIIITCLVIQKEKESSKEFCNFANVRYLLNNFGKNGEGLINFISKYADPMTLNDFKGFISNNEKTTQGFIATALSVLAIFGTNSISKLTAQNEIDFEEIRRKKTIIYLIIPQHELNSYAFLLSLFYARFFKSCFENTKSNKNLPVYCLLDEAGHIKIPNLATVITTIRKYKVSISLIFQSLSQIESLYGINDTQTILGGGVNSKIFFAGCDDQTCDKLSKLLGNITVSERNQEGKFTTLIRPLLNSNQIRMLKDNQAIYLFSNKKPILLKIKPYFKHLLFKIYSTIKPFEEKSRILKEVNFIKL